VKCEKASRVESASSAIRLGCWPIRWGRLNWDLQQCRNASYQYDRRFCHRTIWKHCRGWKTELEFSPGIQSKTCSRLDTLPSRTNSASPARFSSVLGNKKRASSNRAPLYATRKKREREARTDQRLRRINDLQTGTMPIESDHKLRNHDLSSANPERAKKMQNECHNLSRPVGETWSLARFLPLTFVFFFTLSSRTQPRSLRMAARDLLFACSAVCFVLPSVLRLVLMALFR
jgi:hypothetical protein